MEPFESITSKRYGNKNMDTDIKKKMNNLDKQFTHPYFPDHTFNIEGYHDKVVIDGVEFTFNNMAQLMGQYQWTLKDIDVNVLLSMAFNQNKNKGE